MALGTAVSEVILLFAVVNGYPAAAVSSPTDSPTIVQKGRITVARRLAILQGA